VLTRRRESPRKPDFRTPLLENAMGTAPHAGPTMPGPGDTWCSPRHIGACDWGQGEAGNAISPLRKQGRMAVRLQAVEAQEMGWSRGGFLSVLHSSRFDPAIEARVLRPLRALHPGWLKEGTR
jgi:hypothetical protein